MRSLPEGWLRGFLEYTEKIQSPQLFRLWAGISVVGAALQRRVYTEIVGQRQYANTYILFISPPGGGKSNAVKFARNLVRKTQHINLTPDDITREAFYLALEESTQTWISPTGAPEIQTSLYAMIDEFGVFVKPNDFDFMIQLTHVYDNPDVFEYRTKHQGWNKVTNAQLSILSGCTPKHLKKTFTEDALEQGFPSRFIMLADQYVASNLQLFDDQDPELNEALEKVLIADLNRICEMRGKFCWDPKSAEAFQAWVDKGMPPVPKHPKLEYYHNRRISHMTKLCMIASAQRSDELIITLEDFVLAKAMLIQAEQTMIEVVDNLSSNPYMAVIERAYSYIQATALRKRRAIMEREVREFLRTEVHPKDAQGVLDQICSDRRLYVTGTLGSRCFMPAELREVLKSEVPKARPANRQK